MCTGDGIVKKKGGNVDSRCGETRWLKVEKERRERERKKKKKGKKEKTPPSWNTLVVACTLLCTMKEGGWKNVFST